MKYLLSAVAPRTIVLLAGSILSGSLAFVVYIAISVGGLDEGLSVEILNRQRALHLAHEDLLELHRMIEHAGDGDAASVESLRDQVARVRAHLVEVTHGEGDIYADVGAEIHAHAGPVLDDLETWMDGRFVGWSPGVSGSAQAAVQRALDASKSIEALLAEAHLETSEILQRKVADLEWFRRSLWPIMAQILLVGALFIVYALRAQRLDKANTTAQNRLRDAIESIPVGFALFDQDARLILCNEQHRNMYPGPKSNLAAGASFHDLIRACAYGGNLLDAADDPEKWLRAREAAFRDRTGSFEVPLSNGRILEVLDRDTGTGGTVAITTDVTQSRAREAELLRIGVQLREKNFQLDTALDNMVIGLAMFDASHRLVFCNRRYLEIYGLPAELGRKGTELSRIMEVSARLQGRDEEETRKIVAKRLAIADNRAETEDWERLAEGRVIKRTHRPMPGGGSIASYEDITARARAERAMRAAKDEAEVANRSKSEFLANVSHELRTPLNAIIGFSEIIKAEMFGPVQPVQYREYASDIHDSGRHLLSLINDILDLSKVESGKFDIVEGEVHLSSAVDAAMRLVYERADRSGVSLINAVPQDLPMLSADPRGLKQMLLNLLSNAVKFTESGGKVTIDAAIEDDGTLAVSVTDTGIGMSARGVQLAMTPFGRVDSTFNRRFEGTGLGLPLTARLAAMHGGSLDVQSEEGVGTCVRVLFPPTRVLPAAPPAQSRQAL